MVVRGRWGNDGGGGAGVMMVVVLVMMVVMGCGCGGVNEMVEVVRRVEGSEIAGWIDRLTRIILGFTGKLRRKSFPAAAMWWPAAAGWPAGSRCSWGRERES
ncbi:hypothetical protein Tco_1334329 [Tanacetum coccineum]